MKIVDIYSEEFKEYGQVIDESQVSVEDRQSLVRYLTDQTEAPNEGNVYVADEAAIHQMPVAHGIKSVLSYKDVQFGYCHGNSTKVNALEWHGCQELVMAATECVLFLGHPKYLTKVAGHLNFDTKDLIAIQLTQGEMVRLDQKILHFAPTKINAMPYRTLIVLEKGTNRPLASKGEGHLFMENKWMLAHAERQDLVDKGAWPGVVGINYDWNNMTQ